MKRRYFCNFATLTWLLLAVCSFTAFSFFLPAEAAINPQIPFYATLKDSSGNRLDGTYDMVFRLYDAPTGGTLLNTSTHTAANGNEVTVTDGDFGVLLGSGTGNDLSGVDFDSSSIYVGISIEGDTEMTPRERLGAAPYAFNADTVDGYHAYDLLRSDATGTISAADTDTMLTIVQSGTGDILNLFDGGSEVFTVLDGGNVGIGTTSPARSLSVAGDMLLTGAFYDGMNSAGANGYVLLSTGTSTYWVATSSLGISGGGGSSLWTQNASNIYFNTGYVGVGTTTPSKTLTVNGDLLLTGSFFDSAYSSGTIGYILQTTASGTQWVATSSLGFSGGGGGSSPFTSSGASYYLTNTNANLVVGTTTSYATSTGLYVAGKSVTVQQGALKYLSRINTDLGTVPANWFLDAMTVSGDYIYGGSYDGDSFVIIDIADPEHMRSSAVIASTTIFEATWGITVRGKYAYVNSDPDPTGRRLNIVDISNPTNPVLMSSYYVGGSSSDVDINGRYLYYAGFRYLSVVDVSDPTDPQLVRTIYDATNLESNVSIDIQGNYLYAGTTLSNNGRIAVYDISDPENPTLIDVYDPAGSGPRFNDVLANGKFLYVAEGYGSGDGGISIYDISNPGDMSMVARIEDVNNLSWPSKLDVAGDYLVVGTAGSGISDSLANVTIVDVSSSTNPIVVGSINDGDQVLAVGIQGKNIFTSSYDGITSYEINNVQAPGAHFGGLYAGALATDRARIEKFLTVTGDGYFGGTLTTQNNLVVGNGITLVDETPATTTNMLYNSSGQLFFNGSVVGGSFVAMTDTPNSLSTGDILYASGPDTLVALSPGINGDVLKLVGGIPTWGADNVGAGGGSGGFWASTTNNQAIYPADIGDVVLIGKSATSSINKTLEVAGTALFVNTQLTGSFSLAGAFNDAISSPGGYGYVLQSTGTSTHWVATSTLGLNGGWGVSGNDLFYRAGRVAVGTNSFTDIASLGGISLGTTTVREGSFLQIGDYDGGALPTTSYIAFGDGGYTGIYEKYDDGFAISAGAGPNSGGDVLILGHGASYSTFEAKIGDIDNQYHGYYLTIDANGANFNSALGVGTTTPGYDLTVDGDMRLTGALYDSLNSAGTDGYVLQSTGSGLMWVASSSLGIVGGGGSSLWSQNASNIYFSTGNVGIGTSTPSQALTVAGNMRLTGDLYDATNAQGSEGQVLKIIAGLPTWSTDFAGGGGSGLWATTSNSLLTQAYPSQTVLIGGLATTSSGYKFEVIGDSLFDSATYSGLLTVNGAGTSTFMNNVHIMGALRVGTSSVHITGNGISSTGDLVLQAGPMGSIRFGDETSTTTLFTDIQSGFVGIGTTTPSTKLTIAADAGTPFIRLADETNGTNVDITTGDGSPAGVVSAEIGSLYIDSTNGTLYIKQSGSGSGGWTEVGTGGGGGSGGYATTTFMAKMNRSSAQSLTHNAYTTIAFDTTEFDTSGSMADTGNGYIVIQRDGKYLINASAGIANYDTGDLVILAISVNGSHVNRNIYMPSAFTNLQAYIQSSTVVDVVEGDIIRVLVFNFEGAAQNTLTSVAERPTMSVVELPPEYGASHFATAGATTYLASTTAVFAIGTTSSEYKASIWGDLFVGTSAVPDLLVETATGKVGIGTSTLASGAVLTVDGTINSSALLGGSINLTVDANGNIIRDPSDERLKTNITDVEDGLTIALALRPVRYNWRDTERFGSSTEIGFIAQDVDLVLPEVVRKGPDYWSINTRNIVAVAIEAIQELWTMVTGNQEKIKELEQRIETLEAVNNVQHTPVSTSHDSNATTGPTTPTATTTPESNAPSTASPLDIPPEDVATTTDEAVPEPEPEPDPVIEEPSVEELPPVIDKATASTTP